MNESFIPIAQEMLEKQKNDLINKMQRLKSQNASLSSQLESAQLLLTDTERRLNDARLYVAEVRNKAEKTAPPRKALRALSGICLPHQRVRSFRQAEIIV